MLPPGCAKLATAVFDWVASGRFGKLTSSASIFTQAALLSVQMLAASVFA